MNEFLSMCVDRDPFQPAVYGGPTSPSPGQAFIQFTHCGVCLLVCSIARCHCHSCQHLVFSSFLIFTQLINIKYYLIVVLICIFWLTIIDFECFLTCWCLGFLSSQWSVSVLCVFFYRGCPVMSICRSSL